MRYSSVLVGRAGARLDRVLSWVLAAVVAVALVPDTFITDVVRVHVFAPIGATYRSPVTTLAGDLAYGLILGVLVIPAVRFGAAWRRGIPNAGVQCLALVCMLLMAVNDLLVISRVYPAPYLVDLAFLLPIATVGYVLTRRFVEDARAHRALRMDLQQQVTERTAELGRAKDALHRAEKLAALGQFAAGVAHEVNNPAAVLTANLHYLADAEDHALSDEGRDAVRESLQSVQRIAAIVRQLLDAGRLAASQEKPVAVPVKRLGDDAMSVARVRCGRRVRLDNELPEDLHVSGHEGVVAQVLVNLVVNAAQAIPDHRSDGRVVIRAETAGERVRVVVDDNGSGMAPEVLNRAFEPFFTTKPFGSGTGLGLAVSRGLIMSLGGDLRLESEKGKGTRATIELTPAVPARNASRAAEERSQHPRLRMLIVDDEPAVLSSLRRLLEPRFGVEIASGVDEGLELLHAQRFDLVLCDVMMPAGGGERFYKTLAGWAPALARRVVFFTGGAVTDAARQFLHSQPQPVLYKPLDVDQLARVAEHLQPSSASGYTTH
jgi:signal transduction histidine kinase/CheY-like chemotaxis protein